MKKIFTFKKSLFVAAMLLMAVGAQAQLKYVPLYGQLKAYPVGAGKVYAEMSGLGVAPEGANYAEPADEVNVKFACRGVQPNGNYKGYAVPNEGWVLAGFATQKYEDGEPMIPTEVEWTDNPRTLKLTSQVYAKADMTSTPEEAFQMFPNDPDEVHYALFTRVTVGIDAFNSNLGSVAIDKAVNDVGTEITLTATPDYTKKASFLHWVEKSTGNKITENPYTFTVSKADEYYAYFENQFAETLHFPEEGGFIHHYGDYYVRYPNDNKIAIYEFEVDGVKKVTKDGKDIIVDEPGVYDYMGGAFAKVPTLLYGKGDLTIVTDTSSTTPGSEPNSVLRWSGDTGVKVDTITTNAAHHYYTFDDKAVVFRLVGDDKFVPAKQVFMAMPDSCVEKLTPGTFPDVIYTSEEQDIETGISNVTVAPTVKKKGVFTIDGRRLEAPEQEGVYIFDGKKVIYRKRK